MERSERKRLWFPAFYQQKCDVRISTFLATMWGEAFLVTTLNITCLWPCTQTRQTALRLACGPTSDQSHRQMSELEKTSTVVWSIWPSSRRASWGLGRQSSRLRITGFNGKTETRTQTSCITRLTVVYRPYHDMAVTLLNGDRNIPFSPFSTKLGIHTR